MKIIQKKIDNKHIDSFFYDGLIAETEDLEFWAVGEIQLDCDDEPENDEEVQKCYELGNFEMNNWFQIFEKNLGETGVGGFCEDIIDDYDDGIDALETLQGLITNKLDIKITI